MPPIVDDEAGPEERTAPDEPFLLPFEVRPKARMMLDVGVDDAELSFVAAAPLVLALDCFGCPGVWYGLFASTMESL
jgi:hypothetical protein